MRKHALQLPSCCGSGAALSQTDNKLFVMLWLNGRDLMADLCQTRYAVLTLKYS